ncbi:MAG: hypothetical protein HRT57_07495 [Crocinitomicaceae bacterium]|nr:hypothetical protein [Crocinitomicaceae bacterium]
MSQFDLYDTITEAAGPKVIVRKSVGAISYEVVLDYGKGKGGVAQLAKGMSKKLANEVAKIVKQNPNKYNQK